MIEIIWVYTEMIYQDLMIELNDEGLPRLNPHVQSALRFCMIVQGVYDLKCLWHLMRLHQRRNLHSL